MTETIMSRLPLQKQSCHGYHYRQTQFQRQPHHHVRACHIQNNRPETICNDRNNHVTVTITDKHNSRGSPITTCGPATYRIIGQRQSVMTETIMSRLPLQKQSCHGYHYRNNHVTVTITDKHNSRGSPITTCGPATYRIIGQRQSVMTETIMSRLPLQKQSCHGYHYRQTQFQRQPHHHLQACHIQNNRPETICNDRNNHVTVTITETIMSRLPLQTNTIPEAAPSPPAGLPHTE